MYPLLQPNLLYRLSSNACMHEGMRVVVFVFYDDNSSCSDSGVSLKHDKAGLMYPLEQVVLSS